MKIIALGEAEREFIQSVRYYETKEPGLGARFRDEVIAVVKAISAHPELPRLRKSRYRRVNLRVFTHYVAYVIRDDTIWIVAIAHAHRRPEYWLGRVREQ